MPGHLCLYLLPVCTNIYVCTCDLTFKNFNAFLFNAGDTVDASVTAHLTNWAGAFSLEFKLLFLPYNSKCLYLTVYEPCIFHPSESECQMVPEHAECRFAANMDVMQLASARTDGCRVDVRGCTFQTSVDESVQGKLAFLESDVPSFRLANAQPTDAGLYVIVGLYNGRPLAWTYVYLSTLETILNVFEDVHKPGFGYNAVSADTPGNFTAAPTHTSAFKEGPTVIYSLLVSSMAAGVILVLLLFALLIVGLYKRHARHRTNGYFQAYPKYSSLPSNDECVFGDGDFNSPLSNTCEGLSRGLAGNSKSRTPKQKGSRYHAWFADGGPAATIRRREV
ncbi:US8 membrane glycoprotein E [Meleagrid alphaherpesvirus 1]|uniref:Envelope glycoprotein E n=1 Tax=Meleagrid herpesvirus 1 TaxID=37108 RepID=Q9DH41_MEHV1|nr:envelope glycoprotein E-related protein [Meleagrid alphaherpesvirus 1]AKQ48622.1 envelope glycoprotein E-related protein [iBAC vector pMeHV1-C7]AKQ48694.1 envelope glycoprotein E-related protein [iBAC vector pMeHV1-C9]AKQ48766.1 envelope glycoprotein E-related protein [iBAC vector pMeHV1-C10]AKQ48838.1 envelope glycoprotein E-related protein [iBAC vector pMeHV1-C17]AKQ48911.1 envelope glycoprotein E-related protein [iBAC vector pMeHV1-C18]